MDTALIPTGRIVGVQGTPLDLTKPTRLGEVPIPNLLVVSTQIAPIKVLDTCPGGEYAGFSHTYVIEENVVEKKDGKIVQKMLGGESSTLAHCATVEERRRFKTKFEIITFPAFRLKSSHFPCFMILSLLSGLGLRVLTSQPGVCNTWICQSPF